MDEAKKLATTRLSFMESLGRPYVLVKSCHEKLDRKIFQGSTLSEAIVNVAAAVEEIEKEQAHA